MADPHELSVAGLNFVEDLDTDIDIDTDTATDNSMPFIPTIVGTIGVDTNFNNVFSSLISTPGIKLIFIVSMKPSNHLISYSHQYYLYDGVDKYWPLGQHHESTWAATNINACGHIRLTKSYHKILQQLVADYLTGDTNGTIVSTQAGKYSIAHSVCKCYESW